MTEFDPLRNKMLESQAGLEKLIPQVEKVNNIPNLPEDKKNNNSLALKQIQEVLGILSNLNLKIANQSLKSISAKNDNNNPEYSSGPRFK